MEIYRVSRFGKNSKYYAVVLDPDKLEDEMDQILQFVNEGNDVIITDDYEQYDAELVDRAESK